MNGSRNSASLHAGDHSCHANEKRRTLKQRAVLVDRRVDLAIQLRMHEFELCQGLTDWRCGIVFRHAQCLRSTREPGATYPQVAPGPRCLGDGPATVGGQDHTVQVHGVVAQQKGDGCGERIRLDGVGHDRHAELHAVGTEL
jgi:hypothetical protein